MELRVPHQVIYQVNKSVPVSDVVASLLASEQLLRDCAPLLEECFPGLVIEKIEVSVGEIAEGSLREILYATLFATFQKDLERDVPRVIEHLSGTHIPTDYNSIVTIVFCLLLFYGAETLYQQVNKGAFSKRIREQFKEVTTELSRESGISEERIASLLESKYGKSRLRLIAHAAVNFFAVSKGADNAAVTIARRTITHDTVSDVPSEAQIEEADVPEIVKSYDNVQIEIHAQDIDRAKTGWAAVVPKVSPKRLRMELYPPIRPEDLYTKRHMRGDVSVVFTRKSDGSYQPSVVHLMSMRQ